MKNEAYDNNKYIEMAVSVVHRTKQMEAFYSLIDVLVKRMREGGEAPMPMVDVNGTFPFPNIPDTANLDEIRQALEGKTVVATEDVRLRMDTVIDEAGNQWIPLFTSEEEQSKKATTPICMNVQIEQILRAGLADEKVEGVVINPFGQCLEIPKKIINIMFKHYMV